MTAGAKPAAEGAAEGAPAAVKPKVEEADAPLPPGWARAKDAQGRTYYWHTQVRPSLHVSSYPLVKRIMFTLTTRGDRVCDTIPSCCALQTKAVQWQPPK